MARDAENGARHREERRNPLEMTVRVASSLIVAGSVGVLAWKGVREERPPALAVRVDSVVARGVAHHVHVTVRNDGDAAAASAQLRVRLLRDTAHVEESEAVVEWIPGRSSARATLMFEEDPRVG